MHPLYTQELADKEKRSIRKLVRSMCANYDHEYECLLLDGSCYMFTVGLTTSNLCRYFKDAALPLNPVLEAIFLCRPVKPCQRCGKKFPVAGRRTYCSPACAHAAKKAATAKRVRKHRNQSSSTVTL